MIPHNLVLTYARCDYCAKENMFDLLVYDNFGIKTCDEHHDLGKSDCKSYIYSKNMIHLQDVKQLVDALPKTFSIQRSSGEMQDGWGIDWDDPYIRKVNGDWHFPCFSKIHNLTKKPSIKNMANIIDPENIISHLELIMSENKPSPAEPEEYVEHPAIERVYVGGVECRMVIASLHQDSA